MAKTMTDILKEEMPVGQYKPGNHMLFYYMYRGFMQGEAEGQPVTIQRAYAFRSLLEDIEKHIYKGDLIPCGIWGLKSERTDIDTSLFDPAYAKFINTGFRHFGTDNDHAAPGYKKLVEKGVCGLLADVEQSMAKYADDQKKIDFLKSVKIEIEAYAAFIKSYADLARELMKDETDADEIARLTEIARVCDKVSYEKPDTFREALQLVWAAHVCFRLEGRDAMALGRIDQYLYPFYKNDIEKGIMTDDEACLLLQNVFMKIGEARYVRGGDDTVNICIGGHDRQGNDAVNDLSFCVLRAVGICKIPGPNLSARVWGSVRRDFLEACLRVIGTGIGYPALMNDDVNIPALERMGYDIEDCRDHCFVGCIENFLQGRQAPWSDGRFNTPLYLEYVFTQGRSLITGQTVGLDTGDPREFKSMDEFMRALEKQIAYGAEQYMNWLLGMQRQPNPEEATSPFLSALTDDCIERGLDINNGGAHYPGAHGSGNMGIATVADSLYAVEEVVFNKKLITMDTLIKALEADFKGYETVQALLLSLPKYGNDVDEVDKYARWFCDYTSKAFDDKRTYNGGRYFIAIASNRANIYAGLELGATPDGRNSKLPMSDAASPAQGRDVSGPTAAVKSLTKPDYTTSACGTVCNQRYSASTFTNEEEFQKLVSLIQVYFKRGGQEIQINCVAREALIDAMERPEHYQSLMTRVSGFSAFYVKLAREVQQDILARTEHE